MNVRVNLYCLQCNKKVENTLICFIKNNIQLITAVSSIMVALAALRIALAAFKHQMITLILSQLHEKAKESNDYLNEELQIKKEPQSISGILSAIITAKQLIKLHYKKYSRWLLFYRKQFLIDNFHLQLHTSIRDWIRGTQSFEDIRSLNTTNEIKSTLETQLIGSKSFLKKSIKKYDKRGCQ